jgi:sporulation protein YlmC with PRC-barrel domain
MRLKHCLAPALAAALMLPVSVGAQEAGQQHGQAGQQGQQQEAQRPADRHDQGMDQQRQGQTATDQQRRDDQATTQDQQRRDDQRATQDQQRDARTQAGQPNIFRADRLIGQAVRDRADERVGRVNDLAVNVKENKVAYAVVTRGGMWGIGGDDVQVPFEQLQPDHQARVVRIESQQLQQARQIDRSQGWPATIGGDGPVGTAGTAPHHDVLPMSNLIGMDVHNNQGERLGTIDDIAIRRDGSLGYAVVAHGGFMGFGDNYVAVPWDRLKLDAQRQGAVLDINRDQFERAQRFEYRDRGETWPERVDWPFTDNR